jgi:hypothetical protein
MRDGLAGQSEKGEKSREPVHDRAVSLAGFARLAWSTSIVGNPAAFQAWMPPFMWLLKGSPAASHAATALAERMPEPQWNTTFRPPDSGSARGSKVESG